MKRKLERLLFINNNKVKAIYNPNLNIYQSKIGIVLTTDGIIESSELNISSHITNSTKLKTSIFLFLLFLF